MNQWGKWHKVKIELEAADVTNKVGSSLLAKIKGFGKKGGAVNIEQGPSPLESKLEEMSKQLNTL